MNKIYSMQLVSITITAGAGGQIQVFQNGVDLGYFRGTKTVIANTGDSISVWCDADPGYIFTKLCTPDGTCTTARPFNFTANMNISMTATFTSTTQPCTQQDNSFMINGKSGTITVKPGQLLTASVRSTTADCLGVTPEWRIIARGGGALGSSDIRVDTGTHTFDSNGCGSTSFTLNTLGTYTLACRWCCSWVGNEHCIAGDTDLPNTVIVKVQETIPPGTLGCDPAICLPDKNLCILGACVPKQLVFIGVAGLLLVMLTRRN